MVLSFFSFFFLLLTMEFLVGTVYFFSGSYIGVPSWLCFFFLFFLVVILECPAGSVVFFFFFWFLQRSDQLVLSFFFPGS